MKFPHPPPLSPSGVSAGNLLELRGQHRVNPAEGCGCHCTAGKLEKDVGGREGPQLLIWLLPILLAGLVLSDLLLRFD